ncbi:MAG: hypothetical protein H8E66_12355 [Planctomycetes bacterium]|nr:hypothetical protein [Planctomycetota bacterium]
MNILFVFCAMAVAPAQIEPTSQIDEEYSAFHDDVRNNWNENLSMFFGLDGSKQPQDLGVNAHMGARAHINFSVPLHEELSIGMQLGSGVNYHDFAVGAVEALQGTGERFQSFTTVGVFQRGDGRWKWGFAYDFLAENYYEGINLGQWRGTVAHELSDSDDFGVWFTVSDHGDSATFLGTPLSLEPISQVNAYWRHSWERGAETSIWVGAAEPHGEELILFPVADPTGVQLVYGADIHVPLNDRLAIFGEANFITPSDSGTVDAYLGVVYYPGGNAQSGRSRRFAPMLPVANNPTFSVDLRR